MNIGSLESYVEIARDIFGEQAIIAGGAPRDILEGRPVKDIDVFVRISCDEAGTKKFRQNCEEFADFFGGEAAFRPCEPGYTDHFDLCDVTHDGGCKFEVIAVYTDPAADVHNYDFGLSQVFVTPNGIFQSPKAVEDSRAKKITYLHNPDRTTSAYYRSKARLARLREKYTDWDFVNCGFLDDLPERVEESEKCASPIPFADELKDIK